MALESSRSYKALTKSSNLLWGGDKFLMQILLAICLILILGTRSTFGYVFGGILLFFGRMGLVHMAKKDSEMLPIFAQTLFFRKFYLGRSIYPGPQTNIIFTFDVKKGKVVSGVPWYWRVYYFLFPTTNKKPSKFINILKKAKKDDKSF